MHVLGNSVIADGTSQDGAILEYSGPLVFRDWCPYKKRRLTQREDAEGGHRVMTEAEPGVRQLQTTERQGLLAAQKLREAWSRFSHRSYREQGPANTLILDV